MLPHKSYINSVITKILLYIEKFSTTFQDENAKLPIIEVSVVKKGVVLRNALLATMCTRIDLVI